MPVRLLVGPAGCGKTSRALEIFKQFTPSEHPDSVRFIAPTLFHVLEIRRVLLSDPEFPGLLGDPICTFYELARGILAQTERVKCISETQRLLILKEIIITAPNGYFDGVRERPNFAEALGGAIRTLKAAAIGPDHLRRAVQSADARLPESSKCKILDLARLYQLYQDALTAGGADDREGIMLRALETAKANPDLLRAFKHIILDGFPSLNPIQREFVRLFAEHSGEVIFALDYEENRPEVFSHVEPTFRFLAELPGASVERLSPGIGASLGHVRAHLFAANPPCIEPDHSVAVLAGATPAVEIELVAREIKRLVREQGRRFSDFAIVSRDVESYRRTVADIFGRYGIPLAAHSRPLSENALTQTVLLSLGIASTQDGTLEARARTPSTIEEAFKTGGARHPPRRTRAVESLVAGFRWREDDRLLQEDFAARRAIRGIMAEITAGEELLGREIGPGEFAAMLESGIHTGRYRTFGEGTDGVSMLDIGALRGQKFPVAFIVGLLERVFPRQAREDPFLRDDEREALNLHLPHELGLRAHDRDHERYLFHTAVGSARDYLYLCYPAAGVSGHESLPSHYLHEIERLFAGPLRRIACDYDEVIPPVEQTETMEALAASVVLDCCAARDKRRQDIAAAAYNLLLEAGQLGPDAFERLSKREAEPPDEDSAPASGMLSAEE